MALTQQGWRNGSASGGGGGSDEKVKISSADTTTNFLENKLVAGANITLNKLNTGANEQIEIVASGGGSSGIIGIANGSGVYTYYASLSLAMAGAISGDTIVFFDNYTETSSGKITLKDGVDINLNGHRFVYDVADATAMFVSVNATTNFYNGVIERLNAVPTTSIEGVVFQIDDSCFLYFYGVEIRQSSDAQILIRQGGTTKSRIFGGRWTGGSVTYGNSATMRDMEIISTYWETVEPVTLTNGVTNLIDSVIINDTSLPFNTALAFSTNCTIQNCYVEKTNVADTSTVCSGTGGLIRNSTFVQRGLGLGLNMSGGDVYDSFIQSVNGTALRLISGSYGKNCTAINTGTNNSIYVDRSEIHDSSGQSNSNLYVLFATQDCTIFNCALTTNGTSPTGSVIYLQNSSNKVAQCTLAVANASKFGIDGNAGQSAQIVGNMGDMTNGALVNTANITNIQTFTEDSFGNLLIGT